MFQAFSRPSSGAQWLQWQPLVLPSYCGDSSVVFVVRPAGRPAWPRTQQINCKICCIWLVICLNWMVHFVSSSVYKDYFPLSCLLLGPSSLHVHSEILQVLLHTNFLRWFWARFLGLKFEGCQCKYALTLAKEVNNFWGMIKEYQHCNK
jgi:hypothetical protein